MARGLLNEREKEKYGLDQLRERRGSCGPKKVRKTRKNNA